MENSFDLVVLGSGPGGYVAAIRAADLGLSVCLIEKENVGGVCLHWGCIPTKTLLKSAHLLNDVKTCASLGIKIGEAEFDFSVLQKRKQSIVTGLAKGIDSLLRARRISILMGEGTIADASGVLVNGQRIGFKNCIIATGSSPVELPAIKMNATRGILSNREILSLGNIPKSLLIIGGGVIGCEFADIFSSLGTSVTIVELTDQLLPTEDADIVSGLVGEFKKRKIKMYNNCRIGKLDGARATLENGEAIAAEKVLLSVGRTPNIEGLDLESLGVKVAKGAIVVNEFMQTSVEGIYAVGDVVGKTFLAHAASHEGIIAAEHIAGNFIKMEYDYIPRCVYTHPQIASVGITEKKAREKGIDIRVGKFPFKASGKALVEGTTQGIVKVISDAKTDAVIGAAVCGHNATELIHVICTGMQAKFSTEKFCSTIFAHPTLSEAISEAFLSLNNKAIHILNNNS